MGASQRVYCLLPHMTTAVAVRWVGTSGKVLLAMNSGSLVISSGEMKVDRRVSLLKRVNRDWALASGCTRRAFTSAARARASKGANAFMSLAQYWASWL